MQRGHTSDLHSWVTHKVMSGVQGPGDTGRLFVLLASQEETLKGVHAWLLRINGLKCRLCLRLESQWNDEERRGVGSQAYLTICSETCLFWNLAGRSRMGFTVKHWMSVRRKVKGLNGDSNWSECRRHLLHTVRILPCCYQHSKHPAEYGRFNVCPYERKREFTNI